MSAFRDARYESMIRCGGPFPWPVLPVGNVADDDLSALGGLEPVVRIAAHLVLDEMLGCGGLPMS